MFQLSLEELDATAGLLRRNIRDSEEETLFLSKRTGTEAKERYELVVDVFKTKQAASQD